MDATTKMLVDKIIVQGWYRASQTLGEGGWQWIKLMGGDFSEYNLIAEEEDGNVDLIEIIYAKHEENALAAFQSLYDLDKFAFWDIQEVYREYRLVATKDKGE